MDDEGGLVWCCWACGLIFDPFTRNPDDVDCPDCGGQDVGPVEGEE